MSKYTLNRGYQKSRRKAHALVVGLNLLILAGVGGFFWHNQSHLLTHATDHVAALETKNDTPSLTAPLPWPAYGQSAYGVGDSAVAVSKDQTKPVPIASLAKVITALAILKEKPLAPGEQGPMITLGEQDVALYGEYLNKNGTVVPVVAGEQISQYQAMQAMLMSSANNISDSLAAWAFGSVGAYADYANGMVRQLGLSNTTVADASGFSPSTVSTAQDMVKLGEMYIKHPVLRQITTQPGATIPVAGKIPNYNSTINKDGLIGVKVGFTDEAGRCFMLANIRPGGKHNDIVSLTVVLGAEHINIAMKDAEKIIKAGDASYDKTAQKSR